MVWSMSCIRVNEQRTFWLGGSSSWHCLQGACPALGWRGSAWAPAACQSRHPALRRQRAQWWHQNGLPCAQTQAAWARRACTPPPAPCKPAHTAPLAWRTAGHHTERQTGSVNPERWADRGARCFLALCEALFAHLYCCFAGAMRHSRSSAYSPSHTDSTHTQGRHGTTCEKPQVAEGY